MIGSAARRLTVRLPPRLPAFVVPAGFTAFIVVAVVFQTHGLRFPTFCLFDTLLGIPCPGCGVTRRIVGLVLGHFGATWYDNAAGAGVLLYFLSSAVFATCETAKAFSVAAIAHLRLSADRTLTLVLLVTWGAKLFTRNLY